ncbi:hypothetical protein EDEG_01244 [Edhazardia aedis USNM 41457]|uniref:SCP domain-containing protein n=1 Tax=Edhazardia aedis (strain USNM 41457) TaxID=1003232 RepID=J9DA14_EDHAE|nr:hypothetical protein EDEG_01244 [Edhazardia aedis USNM 41457]|eukprot:EJW04561.1 hypothetical protein EDEG_01244 [Edhazardia aedis USNM 41457]
MQHQLMFKILIFAISAFCSTAQLIEAINKFRLQNRQEPLKNDEHLTIAAQEHADYMKKSNTVTHFSRGKSHTLLDRIQNSKYEHLKNLGQYVFMTNDDTYLPAFQEVLRMNEKDKYLLKPFEDIGVALSQTPSGRTYWAIVFASKFDSSLIESITN